MLKNQVIHGVGKTTVFEFNSSAGLGRKMFVLTRQETANWTLSMEETDVSGGDSLDPFESFETARAQSVTFENNEFDLQMLEASVGKRPVKTYSAPIYVPQEGAYIPASPGPYTVTLEHATTCNDSSVLIAFSETREEFAPPLAALDHTLFTEDESGSAFSNAESVVVTITAVLNNGNEGCGTAATAHVIAAAVSADLVITLPSSVLTPNSAFPQYDADILGFNIYVNVDAGGEELWNATPIAASNAGSTYTITGTGTGAGSADATPTDSGQYTISSGVITFAAADAGLGVLIDYDYTTSATTYEAEVVDILTTCLRRFVSIIWKGKYQTRDGNVGGLQAVIHKAKYDGDFSLDFNRADASSHSLTFKILDPERPDGVIVSWTKVDLGAADEC